MTPLDALHTPDRTNPLKEDKSDGVEEEDARGVEIARLVMVPVGCCRHADRADTTCLDTALIALAASILNRRSSDVPVNYTPMLRS